MMSRPIVLCYHRVSIPTETDINKLCVSPEIFCEQLKLLAKKKRFVSIEELCQKKESNTVALTFDDGYFDNYQIVGDILTDLAIPASFYLATRYVAENRFFYTTSLAKVWAHRRDSEVMKLLDHSPARSLIESNDSYWEALRELSGMKTEELWHSAVALSDAFTNLGVSDELERPMSKEEVIKISQNSLFSIGPHTATHPRLSLLNIDQAIEDFAESMFAVDSWREDKTPHLYFPHPFGQKSDFTKELNSRIRTEYEFEAMSTLPKAVTKRSISGMTQAIPRLSVQNWSPDYFMRIISAMELFSYVPFLLTTSLYASRKIRQVIV
jgi:peptidoglycan/xylan/chitin deacetylase (PgdA/CDA1 family)